MLFFSLELEIILLDFLQNMLNNFNPNTDFHLTNFIMANIHNQVCTGGSGLPLNIIKMKAN